MRRRTLTSSTAVLLASLAALVPTAVRATNVDGFIGGSSTRTDTWEPHGQYTQYSLNGGVNAAGNVGGSDIVGWNLAAAYGQDRALAQDQSTTRGILTYGARASLFDVRGSSLILRGGAARTQIDFTQSGTSSFVPGTSTTDSYFATVLAGGGDRPVLQVTGDLSNQDISNLDSPTIQRTSKGIDATASSSNENYGYQLGYRARRDTGSYASMNSDTHNLMATARSRLTPETDANLVARYYTRSPTVSDPSNPMYDDTMVGINSLSRFQGSTLTTGYGFNHLTVTAPGLPDTEHAAHSLNATNDRVIAPEWSIVPSATVGFSEDRVGAARTSAAGQSFGAVLRWNRVVAAHSITVEGGGSAGLVEPASGPTQGSWSLTGNSRYARDLGSGGYGAGYNVSYSQNGNSELGWSLTQGLSVDASLRVTDSSRLQSNLLLDTNRGQSPTGGGANRNAILNVALVWPEKTIGLSATATDGTAGNLGDPIRGDGLFLPPSYQTHSRSVQVFGAVAFPPHLSLNANARYGTTSGPDFGNRQLFSATGSLAYAIGQFSLSVTDTYTAEGLNYEFRYNQFMISFARSFRL